MRDPSYFVQCHETPMFLVRLFIGAFLCGLILYILSTVDSASTELACRNGKLYEVSYEQNLTIYDPTFNNCEEIK